MNQVQQIFRNTRNEISKAFFDVMNTIALLSRNQITDQILKESLIKEKLLQLKKILQKQEQYIINYFIDSNYDLLLKLKFQLIDWAKNYPWLRSQHDIILGNILNLKGNQMEMGITRTLKEFVKGITYFKEERNNQAKPVYHRFHSCRRNTSFDCNDRIRLYKCYLERLIYNEIFKNNHYYFEGKIPLEVNIPNVKQNEQHLYQISKLEDNFKKCFSGLRFIVQLEFSNLIPYYLRVFYYMNDEFVFVEEFEKSPSIDLSNKYASYVNCYRYDGKGKEIKRKVQGYDFEVDWENPFIK